MLAAVAAASCLAIPSMGDTAARPFVSPLFTNGTVLQRGHTDPVWGWATPGSKVTVRVAGKNASGTADRNGKWEAKLSNLPVGGPYTMQIVGPTSTTVLNDVLVGDVWVCSGQSNMEFGIGNGINADQEIAHANYPNIHIYTVDKEIPLAPQLVTVGHWDPVTSATIKNQGTWNGFSAVGYFFGRDLYNRLHVPIGLIQSSWGGTPAESWTSAEALAKHVPEFDTDLALLPAAGGGQSIAVNDITNQWYKANDPGSSDSMSWADPALDTSGWKSELLPGFYQQAGIPELTKFNGIIWFRRTLDIADDMAGKDAVLHLLVDDNDTTFIDGKQVGATTGFNVPRNYTIPGSMLTAGKHVIAVRILDTGGVGGIYGTGDQMSFDSSNGDKISLAGHWQWKIGAPLASLTTFPTLPTGNAGFPTVLYNGMISPLLGYGIRGAIWYQGENNAGKAYQYRTLLPTMINDWRARWGQGNFPFYIVQLANYMAAAPQPVDDAWAELREAQTMTAQHEPNSGIATAIDIGNPSDIHPKNKQELGRRLALVALAKTYGEKVHYSGPVYKSMNVDGSSIRIQFRHIAGGLVLKESNTAQAFAIAGADHKFVWATAKLDGDSVVVSSPLVPNPVAVRYAWAANPGSKLYNQAGLPALPFRTDDWHGITYGIR